MYEKVKTTDNGRRMDDGQHKITIAHLSRTCGARFMHSTYVLHVDADVTNGTDGIAIIAPEKLFA